MRNIKTKIMNSLKKKNMYDNSGLSSVEFALIAPVLIAVFLGLANAANFAVASVSMNRAVRAGIQYAMKDGTGSENSNSIVHSIVTKSWTGMPSDGTVSVSTSCNCQNAPISCQSDAFCTDGSYPIKKVTVMAEGTIVGVLTSHSKHSSVTVRVQ